MLDKPMSVSYFKRFKMELDLAGAPPPSPLPDGYFWIPWDEGLIDLHAEVQYRSFSSELDSTLFPCFSDRIGCQHLLREVRRKAGFLPEATWLIACSAGCCGTIQSVADRQGYGSIQNLGVVPAHRGLGIGTALVSQALHGFLQCGLARAYLEVTAQNAAALQLYQRLGFRRMKTLYKAVEVEEELSVVY